MVFRLDIWYVVIHITQNDRGYCTTFFIASNTKSNFESIDPTLFSIFATLASIETAF